MRLMNNKETLFESFQENLKETSTYDTQIEESRPVDKSSRLKEAYISSRSKRLCEGGIYPVDIEPEAKEAFEERVTEILHANSSSNIDVDGLELIPAKGFGGSGHYWFRASINIGKGGHHNIEFIYEALEKVKDQCPHLYKLSQEGELQPNYYSTIDVIDDEQVDNGLSFEYSNEDLEIAGCDLKTIDAEEAPVGDYLCGLIKSNMVQLIELLKEYEIPEDDYEDGLDESDNRANAININTFIGHYEYQPDIEPEDHFRSSGDSSYFTVVKNEREAEKFNYHSDYWGSEDEYQEENVELVSSLEYYIESGDPLYFEDEETGEKHFFTVTGVAIDRQYNSISHTKILIKDFNSDESETESKDGLDESDNNESDYTLVVADSDKISELENGSAFTFEGLDVSDESIKGLVDFLKENTKLKTPVTIYNWKGKEFNEKYGLTGDNAYPDDLNFVSISLDSWSEMGNLPMIKLQVGARWLDDIVDNNARRQNKSDE